MRLSAHRPIPEFLLAAACAAFLALVSLPAGAQDDPPPEAGRVSYISGNVSVQPVGSDDWGQAYPNLPVGPGDRIFTDSNGRAEIQVGQTYVRIGPNSDVSLVDDSQFGINVGVAQGSIRLHSFGLWPRQLLDVSTPNGNAEFANHGDMRVDVMPTDGATIFTNLGDFADITAAGDYRQELDAGQALELAGSNPVYPQWLQSAGPDDLDYWSQQRDQMLSRVRSFQYVSPDIPGAADLDQYGDWQGQSDYGAIWFPRDVPAGWSPYHYGHWVNHAPWGWVWVEDESWGYAPFHYGRWVSYGGRWGWVPGPANVRPVWSPALVVFAGGIHFGGGGGVSVWFPLGPGEAYRPWYHCSPRYIDQVNMTNIRESPRVHVQTTYVNIVNVTNVTYINQSSGATAMRQEDFAAGRSAHNTAVRIDPQQMQHIQPLARPEAVPTKESIVTRPVTRPVQVSVQRPNLINQQGKMIAARPGAIPVQPPVRPAPPVRPLPGRVVIATPPHPAPGNPGARPAPPAQGGQNLRPNQPEPVYQGGQQPRPNPVQPTQNTQRPVEPFQQNQEPNQRPQPPANNPQPPAYRPTPPPTYHPAPQPEQPKRNEAPPPSYNPPNRPAPPQPEERPAPPPPAYHPPQERPAPPPPQERPAPPPPQARPAPPPPQQQAKPAQQNKNNKDEKKNENKKPE